MKIVRRAELLETQILERKGKLLPEISAYVRAADYIMDTKKC